MHNTAPFHFYMHNTDLYDHSTLYSAPQPGYYGILPSLCGIRLTDITNVQVRQLYLFVKTTHQYAYRTFCMVWSVNKSQRRILVFSRTCFSYQSTCFFNATVTTLPAIYVYLSAGMLSSSTA